MSAPGLIRTRLFWALVSLTLLAMGFPGSEWLSPVAVILVISLAKHPEQLTKAMTGAVLAIGAIALLGGVALVRESSYSTIAPIVVSVAVAIGLVATTAARNWIPSVLALLLTGVLLVALPEVGIDVLFLHKAAGQAIVDGQGPFSDAVTVPNGAPTAEAGDVIVGYPYPAPTMVVYALGSLLWDPRIVSAVAIVLTVTVVGLSRRDESSLNSSLLLSASATIPLILFAAWTEPLSLLYLIGAASVPIAWVGPVAGIAIASKQYLVVLLPIVLLAPLLRSHRVKALAVGAAATLVPLALSGVDFIRSNVLFHLDQPPRTDSQNLYGLVSRAADVSIWPGWVSLAAGLLAATWLAPAVVDRASFLRASAAALAITFFLGSQAFPNYWFLVFGLTAAATAFGRHPSDAGTSSGRVALG